MFYVDGAGLGADVDAEWPIDMTGVEEYTTACQPDLDLVADILKQHEGIDLDVPLDINTPPPPPLDDTPPPPPLDIDTPPPPPSPYSPCSQPEDKLDIILSQLDIIKNQHTAATTSSVSVLTTLMATIAEQSAKIASLEKQLASCTCTKSE